VRWVRWVRAGALGAAVSGCVATGQGGPMPVYDAQTRQLVRLDWDTNGDARIDQRTYFVGAAAARTEVDGNHDGRIDRWEYVDRAAVVTRVGTSSADDGLEDTWTWPPDAGGEVRVDRAQYRDGMVDRRDYLVDGALVRAEEDANRDGLVDKWERWQSGMLIVAAFDTSFSTGRPDRRVVYDAGRFRHLETDVHGNGRFERLAINQPGGGTTRDRH
jgi:hypothetical protein